MKTLSKETLFSFIMGTLALIFSIISLALLTAQYKELKEYRNYYDKTEHLIYTIKDSTILSSNEFKEYKNAFNLINHGN